MKIDIDYAKCIGYDCLDCLDICPMNVFDIKNESLIVAFNDRCVYCQACVDVCMVDAISLY